MKAWGWVLLGIGIWGAVVIVLPVAWVGLCAWFGDLTSTGGPGHPRPPAAGSGLVGGDAATRTRPAGEGHPPR